MKISLRVFVVAIALTGCAQTVEGQAGRVVPSAYVSHTMPGLGKVLSSAYGGQILGFDADQNGTDGLLAETAQKGSEVKSAVETFDLTTAKITKVVKTMVSSPNDDFVTFGIVGNDVGFIDEQRVETDDISRHDKFFLLNPVTGEKITAKWQPPHRTDSVLYQQAENQNTNEQVSVVFRQAFTSDVPWLYVWNSSTNVFMKFIKLAYTGEAMGEDTTTDEAVLGSQSGNGVPLITLVSLKTEKLTTFPGLNNGPYGAGGVNGLAIDSNTGTACTTTELNAQVEFYDLATKSGFAAQLPGTGSASQLNSATAVAADEKHQLFLVAQPVSSVSTGSTIYVYDEKGTLEKTLNGFNFSGSTLPVTKIAVNPTLRTGWVNGPNLNSLQQFFY